jgi:hypothetical protein
MDGNIRIYKLPKGRGTDPEAKELYISWSVPRPEGSLYILVLPSISVTIVFIELKTHKI